MKPLTRDDLARVIAAPGALVWDPYDMGVCNVNAALIADRVWNILHEHGNVVHVDKHTGFRLLLMIMDPA